MLTGGAEIILSSEAAFPCGMKNLRRIFQMKRKPDLIKNRIWKGKLHALVVVALILATAVILFSGCSGSTYTQTISITVEPASVSGLLAKIEYYRDSELVNSMLFIDGNGDSIIDGKSGPTEQGCWPKGWEWFDDLYCDVIVGHSTIAVVGEKIKVQDGTTYELLPAEYECG